jgi:CRP/FNR family cyclic AMP-dependent transcriptional regulator
MAARDPAIGRIGDPVLRELASRGRIRHFEKGSHLIREGETGDSLFVLLGGKVKVYVADASGRQMTLARHGPGSHVGEMALDGRPRSASVQALEPTDCAEVAADKLLAALRADPQLALRLLLNLIERRRHDTGNLKDLALMDVYGRIARLLRELDYETVGGAAWSRERLTQQEIASRVGASRDMVGRILKDLRAGGYIDMREKRFRILRRPPARW